jgi:hypothetical protein
LPAGAQLASLLGDCHGMALSGEPEGEARSGYATTVDEDVEWH